MNEQERLALQWAEQVKSKPAVFCSQDALAAAEHILATTTPPTMADVEWNDEEHHLAGATTPEGNEVVMIHYNSLTGRVATVDGYALDSALTPNGKRYELVEVSGEPERPETLTTLEDYANAPVGTNVAGNGYFPYVKSERGYWMNPSIGTCSNEGLAAVSRRVLRWGWDA